MPNQPDNAIDKVLAGLRDAAPPEGLESRVAARIAERLEQSAQHAQTKAASRWGGLLTGQSLTAAWFRGAATGAAFALLAVAAMLALRHAPTPKQQAVAAPILHNTLTPVAEPRVTPCSAPAVLRIHRTAAATQPTLVAEARIEAFAPSHPAPALPLTPQERALVRIASTADPQQLATINPETEARLQAQRAAEFDKFFAPRPAPPAAESHE